MKSLTKKSIPELDQILNSLEGDELVMRKQLTELNQKLEENLAKQIKVEQEKFRKHLHNTATNPAKDWLTHLEPIVDYSDPLYKERARFLNKQTLGTITANGITTRTGQPAFTIRLGEETETAHQELANLLMNTIAPHLATYEDDYRKGKLIKIYDNSYDGGSDYAFILYDNHIDLHNMRSYSRSLAKSFTDMTEALAYVQLYMGHSSRHS